MDKNELEKSDLKKINKTDELPDGLLLEKIDINRSDIIEDALLQIGEILADTFLKTDRYDEAMILDELTGPFCYAAACYAEQAGQIRGDLGVSLSEATLMKLEAFRRNNFTTPSDNEWLHFAKDAQQTIKQAKRDRHIK